MKPYKFLSYLVDEPAKRVIEKQSWTAKPHHFFYFFSLFRLVAVNCTLFTCGFLFFEGAKIQSFEDVVEEFLAFRTEGSFWRAVLCPTVYFNHLFYCSFFSFDGHRVLHIKSPLPKGRGGREEMKKR